MPLPTMVFLSGVTIIIGVILVAYGVSQPAKKKSPSSESFCSGSANDCLLPTDDVIELHFTQDRANAADRIPAWGENHPWEPAPPQSVRVGILSRISSSALGILKTPLIVFGKRRDSKAEDRLDSPLAAGVVLNSIDSDAPEPTIEKK